MIIEDFCTEDVESLRKEMYDILENMDLSDNPKSVFTTGQKQVRYSKSYFLFAFVLKYGNKIWLRLRYRIILYSVRYVHGVGFMVCHVYRVFDDPK